MKKTVTFLAFLFLVAAGICQSVGIGTAAPDASAQVDISSSTKGILIPRLTTTERNAINSSAKGLLLYDSTEQRFMYYNSGWKSVDSLHLPYSATTANVFPLFQLTNNGPAQAIYGKTQSGIGIHGSAFDGYGGYFSSSSSAGTALGIDGKLRIGGSTGTPGSLLSVNNNGYPQWMAPVAFCAKDLGTVNQSIASSTDTEVNFTAEEYDLGADYSTITNTFTVPVNGVYHFDACILWNSPAVTNNYFSASLFVNGTLRTSTRTPAIAGSDASNTISMDVNLTAGQTVKLYAYQTTGATQTLNQDGRLCRFSGRLVMLQ